MGARKKLKADQMKEERKSRSVARLNNYPTSPRKMRLVADMIRGEEVFKAMSMLTFTSKQAADPMGKLLRSAVANWEAKNEGERAEEAGLVVAEVFVDSARMLKRLQPAPQGRAHRIRKRSNHVTIEVAATNMKD